MTKPVRFSQKNENSSSVTNIIPNKVMHGGPTPEEQNNAIVEGRYWLVLNQFKFRGIPGDQAFSDAVNAFKHALQTFGPTSDRLPDLRNNVRTDNKIFHGHVKLNSTTFIIEWAILDQENRILAILDFGTHENFTYTRRPLRAAEINAILVDPLNVAVAERAASIIESVKNKENSRVSGLRI